MEIHFVFQPELKYSCNVYVTIHTGKSIHLKTLEWTFMVHGHSKRTWVFICIHAEKSIHLKTLEWTFMVHGHSIHTHGYPCAYVQ